MLWLAKELPADKKMFRGSCAKKNIVHLSGQKRIIRFRQKSAANKRDAIFRKIKFVKSLMIQCLQYTKNLRR
jgi:hypothetical protein